MLTALLVLIFVGVVGLISTRFSISRTKILNNFSGWALFLTVIFFLLFSLKVPLQPPFPYYFGYAFIISLFTILFYGVVDFYSVWNQELPRWHRCLMIVFHAGIVWFVVYGLLGLQPEDDYGNIELDGMGTSLAVTTLFLLGALEGLFRKFEGYLPVITTWGWKKK